MRNYRWLRILMLPAAVAIVLLVRLLAKAGILIRFGEVWSWRLGHMAGNMECYLCERAAGLQRGIDLFAHKGEPANKQLAKMIERRVFVDPTKFVLLLGVVNRSIRGWEPHAIDTAQVDRDIHNLFEKYPPQMSFTARELARGRAGLRALGIPDGAKWVYLIVRDSAKHPQLPYHSYRNAEIAAHAPAALALAERGYYVVRMGKNVAEPMPVRHPRIIDFAMRTPHDDFMAMYLGAHCAFCVSTGTGPDAIPVIFRRPVCYVNYVPIEYLQTYHRHSLAIWKHHYRDGKRMTLPEIYLSQCGQFMAAQQFAEAGITLVDNTPEEICAAVREMADSVEGAPVQESLRQARFWREFPTATRSAYNGKPLHGKINMRIGAEFLRQYYP